MMRPLKTVQVELLLFLWKKKKQSDYFSTFCNKHFYFPMIINVFSVPVSIAVSGFPFVVADFSLPSVPIHEEKKRN